MLSAKGKVNQNVEPLPTMLSTPTCPPCRSTTVQLICKPSPNPTLDPTSDLDAFYTMKALPDVLLLILRESWPLVVHRHATIGSFLYYIYLNGHYTLQVFKSIG